VKAMSLINYIDNFFKISKNNSTIKTELLSGLSTFLSMSYIIFVNPLILSNAGMDSGSVFVATILISAFATILMGLYANMPLALAPGMGTNSWFVYGIVITMGYNWQLALGGVFLSGILMLIFSATPLRQSIINSLTDSFKMAMTSGVGLFIALIGFKTSGIFVPNSNTFASLGDFTSIAIILTLLSLIIIFICESLKIKGSVLIAIGLTSIISLLIGLTHFSGIVSSIPSIEPTFMKLDIKNAFNVGMLSLVFTLFVIDYFDSTSLLVASSNIIGNKDSKQFKKALIVDSSATSIGSLLGVSTTTAYSESIVGINQGGRTGLVSLVVGILFISMLFFSPLLSIIPSFVGSAVMIYVGSLMFYSLKKVDWEDITEVIPTFIMIITIPLTFSVFNGIGLAILTWIILKIIFKKWQKDYVYTLLIAIIFLLFNIFK
jgi:AGZA family xanthine/uracil permease-like MFS transporter